MRTKNCHGCIEIIMDHSWIKTKNKWFRDSYTISRCTICNLYIVENERTMTGHWFVPLDNSGVRYVRNMTCGEKLVMDILL